MTREPPRDALDIGSLLSIDVGAELRKLSQAQLQGPWQIPAELVRRAIARGARVIDVDLGRHMARVRDDGAGLAPGVLASLAVLLDPARPDAERHAALGALEGRGELALLAIAGMAPRSIAIRARTAGVLQTLDHAHGASQLVEAASPGPDGTEVILHAAALDRRACRDWLATAARFASVEVRADGEPLPRGFARALAQTPLRPPLRGLVALPIEGDTAHAWLLEHGIVTDRIAIPDAPCFEASLELGTDGADGPGAGAVRLREAVLPLCRPLVDQAIDLLLVGAREAGVLPEPSRARLSRLVLRAARRVERRPEVTRAAVFRAVDAGGERLVDLETLAAAIRRDDGAPRTLRAIYPGQPPARFALDETPILIADEAERSRLAERLQVGFESPAALDARGGLAAGWRRALDATERGLARLLDRALHPLRPPAIPDDDLTAEEQALVALLREHLAGAAVPAPAIAMREGAGPIRRPRGRAPRWLLPRRNPTVRAAVAAVARDPRWAWAAWLALLDGPDGPDGIAPPPPEALRRAWRDATDAHRP